MEKNQRKLVSTRQNGNGNGNGGNGNGGNGGGMSESKSGDSSLRDWFSKSKSSDGKMGGFNLVVNMQENPVPDNQDKQQNQSAVLVK